MHVSSEYLSSGLIVMLTICEQRFQILAIRDECVIDPRLATRSSTNMPLSPSPEVVLATLIPAFKFELTDKPISWNAAGVAYPSVGDSTKPEMPLRVNPV